MSTLSRVKAGRSECGTKTGPLIGAYLIEKQPGGDSVWKWVLVRGKLYSEKTVMDRKGYVENTKENRCQ